MSLVSNCIVIMNVFKVKITNLNLSSKKIHYIMQQRAILCKTLPNMFISMKSITIFLY